MNIKKTIKFLKNIFKRDLDFYSYIILMYYSEMLLHIRPMNLKQDENGLNFIPSEASYKYILLTGI